MNPELDLFDSRETFEVKIRSGGIRTCRLRFPTDAESIDRAQQFLFTQETIGKGKTVDDVAPTEAYDGRLFDKLVKEVDGDPFDDYEKQLVIDRIETITLLGDRSDAPPDWDGDRWKLTFEVFGSTEDGRQKRVVFLMKEPKRKDQVEFAKLSSKVISGRRVREMKLYLEPSRSLFKKLYMESEGYAPGSDVPVVHQAKVVEELIRIVGEF